MSKNFENVTYMCHFLTGHGVLTGVHEFRQKIGKRAEDKCVFYDDIVTPEHTSSFSPFRREAVLKTRISNLGVIVMQNLD